MQVDPLVSKNRTLAQQLRGTFALVGGLAAAGFLLTALTYGIVWAWLMPESDQVRLASRAEGAAKAAMISEEASLRAYVLTRDHRFLESYLPAEVELAQANNVLTAYAGLVSEVGASMLGMRLAEERWSYRWAKIAADPGPDAVAPSMSEGKALFEAYRSEEAAFAAALDQHAGLIFRRQERVVAARVGFVLTVFLAMLLLALRQHRALRDSIVAPIEALLRHITGVRDGQLDATVEPTGPSELCDLGEGINEMVRALVAARESALARDEILRRHAGQLRQIINASREFSESLNLRYVVGAVRASTAALGGYERVIVWLMDDEERRLINAEEQQDPMSSDGAIAIATGLAARAAKSGRVAFEGPAGDVRLSDDDMGPIQAIAIPLIVGARIVGALEARRTQSRTATTEEVEVLEMLAMHAATAIESARLHELTEERSQMDALTRLFNRRRLDEDLDAECKRCTRYGRPLAFVMLDVDHFKAFNDSHGHPQADAALQQVAHVVAGCVRTTDTAYRYGGEEFCILLRETNAHDAMIFAERVRQRIEKRFDAGIIAGITASFGVAELSPATPVPRALVEAADAAMYESKHAGRNRVSLSSIPPFALGVPDGELEPHPL